MDLRPRREVKEKAFELGKGFEGLGFPVMALTEAMAETYRMRQLLSVHNGSDFRLPCHCGRVYDDDFQSDANFGVEIGADGCGGR
jgi:hypothetical protein